MKFRSAFAVLSMTVALAACGNLPFQQEERAADTPSHSGPPTVSPLEQPIETGAEARPVATAEASTMATAMFRAAGAGWTVTAADKSAVYERPGAKSVGVSVRRMAYARGAEFIGNMNGQVFALNIRAEACEIGGQKTPFTANLRVGSQRLTGCAAPTDSMPKAQVKASSAGPKPKAAAKPAAPAAKPAAPKPAAETPASTTTPATSAPETSAPSTTTPAAPTTAPAAPETGAATAPAASTATTVTAPETGSSATTPAPAESGATSAPADSGTKTETPAAPAGNATEGGATPAPVLPPTSE
ncbi:hypothetical protein SAMN04488021_101152 [Paracoccus aminovorans]|uniref:Uncharacterized protein n=1 Tax=Paracoccus aminovorans TaxID=34004 RepID=A0A1I2XCM7_9RHOB|nr:hypothetical protein [Paracoccus aminovorans]CQR85574.1 hypothetical protein JCM7685_0997 [Paracoccus aminovorans]SFH09761.1 hypothetical protein SAMN04488021_101152 [Paracoccus aminovorans]